MPKIDPEILKQAQQGTVIQEYKDANGMILGYKGRFCKDVFDNFTECLRENARAYEIQTLKAHGLNEHGQTKEQIQQFNKRMEISKKIKERADLALAAGTQA